MKPKTQKDKVREKVTEILNNTWGREDWSRSYKLGYFETEVDKISELESRKLQIILESKFEVGFNMLCPRCGLAGHSPEDYKKCVKAYEKQTTKTIR